MITYAWSFFNDPCYMLLETIFEHSSEKSWASFQVFVLISESKEKSLILD